MKFLLVGVSATTLLAQSAIHARPDVQTALRWLEANHDAHFARQIKIAEIPPPTFDEKLKGQYIATEYGRLGLKNIETDARGNVYGWRPGKSR